MSADVSMYRLAELSFGSADQPGVVNFPALRTLVHAMLDHMNIRTVRVKWVSGEEDDEEEEKEEEEGGEETKNHRSGRPSYLEDKLRQIQTNEEGVSKCLSLVQDLLREIQQLKGSGDLLKEEVKGLHTTLEQMKPALLEDSATAVEQCCHRVDQLERSLRDKVERGPEPGVLLEDLVSWEALQSALLSERGGGQHTHQPSPRNEVTAEDGPAASRYADTLEALSAVGRLRGRHDDLEERVEKQGAELARLDDLARLAGSGGGDGGGHAANSPTERLSRDREMSDVQNAIGQLRTEFETLRHRLVHLQENHEEKRTQSDMQKAIARLQAECERLRETTRHLQENHDEKSSHTQQLYRTLEETKADKQLLETEIQMKAQVQLDTEQLSAMFQDLLTKVTGHEEDWHEVNERLSREMEGKVTRVELDSLRRQLEDRWRSVRKELRSLPPPPPSDGAAAMTRQLVAGFRCLSCSVPVNVRLPGPHILAIPSAPCFPRPRSSRAFCVCPPEQVVPRQQSERQSPGSVQGSLQVARPPRDVVVHLPPIHRHPGHTQAPELEHLPETLDYGDATRPCGGRLTFAGPPSWHSTRAQQLVEAQSVGPALPRPLAGEVVITGSDGQIYKGRLSAKSPRTAADQRLLPTLSPREGGQRSGSAALPRPQSGGGGRTERGRPGSAGGSGRARPAAAAAADERRSLAESSGEVQRRAPVTELHVDLRPPEGEGEGPGTNL